MNYLFDSSKKLGNNFPRRCSSSKIAQKSNLSFVIFDELTGKRVLSRKGEYASESQRIFNGFLYDCATAMPFKNNYKGYNESS